MRWIRLGRTLGIGALATMCLALAVPAHAQLGSVQGRIVDAEGNPVPDAELLFEFVGDFNYKHEGKTDSRGEFTRAGLYAVNGVWRITATKGNMVGGMAGIDIIVNGLIEVGDIMIRAGAAAPPAGMSDEELAAEAKRQAELKVLFDEVNAALSTEAYGVAVDRLTQAAAQVPDCEVCYLRMGDVFMRQGDRVKAEEAYQQAITINASSADAYDGLAVLFNQQQQFTEAAAASTKANELRAAAGGGAVDAMSLFNAGVIFWNQSKMEEASVQFEQALKADPNMANAHYYYGMTLLNLGKVPEAKGALEKYLQLDPNGENAPTAKAVLEQM